MRGARSRCDRGRCYFDRPVGGIPAPVRIRSPFALIAVRGTRFFTGPSNGRFGVFVERGSVAVTSAGRTCDYAKKFGSHSKRSGRVTTATRMGANIFKMKEISRHKSADVLSALCRRGRAVPSACVGRHVLRGKANVVS